MPKTSGGGEKKSHWMGSELNSGLNFLKKGEALKNVFPSVMTFK